MMISDRAWKLFAQYPAFGLMVIYSLLVCLMLLAAGHLDWWRGWIFIIILFTFTSAGYVYLKRVNPDLIVARTTRHQGTELWDKIWLKVFVPLALVAFVSAPLDTERWRLWPLSLSWFWIGFVLFVLGIYLVIWAEAVNPFFEPTVRIQRDRGHYVVNRGPYAYIRHPGYLGMILMFPSIALMLGSGLSLTIFGLLQLAVIVRTVLEDQTLAEKLSGYRHYMETVPYRLLPGIW